MLFYSLLRLRDQEQKDAETEKKRGGKAANANAAIVVKIQPATKKSQSNSNRQSATEKRVPWRKKRKVIDAQNMIKEAAGAKDLFGDDGGFDARSLQAEQSAPVVSVVESGIQLPPDFDMKVYETEKTRQENTIARYGSVVKAIASQSLEERMDVDDPRVTLPEDLCVNVNGYSKPVKAVDQADVDLMFDEEFNNYAHLLKQLNSLT
eukprot:TRINITY_DN2775_c0_g1_i4.p1 TRINITY_DN2775_c0_g1~~TRINITY_DN2775_c0_g1_i4.p1  ORF type:complete len:207 (+),score=65.41 TRINITY_DN2775_c0_g1_i4:66-686(+)